MGAKQRSAGRAGLPITALILGGSIELGADMHALHDDAYFVRRGPLVPQVTGAWLCLVPLPSGAAADSMLNRHLGAGCGQQLDQHHIPGRRQDCEAHLC